MFTHRAFRNIRSVQTHAAEEKNNFYGDHYVYYRCTKKKDGVRCGQKYVNVVELEKQKSKVVALGLQQSKAMPVDLIMEGNSVIARPILNGKAKPITSMFNHAFDALSVPSPTFSTEQVDKAYKVGSNLIDKKLINPQKLLTSNPEVRVYLKN